MILRQGLIYTEIKGGFIMKRVFLIVLDSVGAGALPDAHLYGDKDAHTLKSISKSEKFNIPNLIKMGIGNIEGLNFLEKKPLISSAVARLCEKSAGKDTTTGHWEIAGVVLDKPFPTFPNGFPKEIIDEFSRRTGRGVLCNKPYSGTQVIKDYAKEHMEKGNLIVYTSADSVFQIAAHEEVVDREELYSYCRIAREILTGENGVGRVIARPFNGEAPDFYRTDGRHDFSLEPPGDTLLDLIIKNGRSVISIGKISDIFASRGISESHPTKNNDDGCEKILEALQKDFEGLCFANLVDFDMVYGHRNDTDGYAAALSRFDSFIPEFIKKMRDDDLLIITADHGCDPDFPGTDHTREYVPMIVYSKKIKGVNLGTRDGFSDVAASVAAYLNIEYPLNGKSFLEEII